MYECGKVYLPLNKIEDHILEDCKERLILCPMGCDQLIKFVDKAKHEAEAHPVVVIEECEECGGTYPENDAKSHSCIKYIMSLFREVVGINAFEMAINNVKGKLNEKVNPATKITSGSQKLGSESGTLEQLLAQ